MIFTDNELAALRESIEATAGFDEELRQRCARFIQRGEFDSAVRKAFILLEERLRQMLDSPGLTGTQLANLGFNPRNGLLARYLSSNESEREGLRELYSGAFKYFRNQAAHKDAGYSAVEGRAIVSFINLLLLMLYEIEGIKSAKPLPTNVELALTQMEVEFGLTTTNHLRAFLTECEQLGIEPYPSASDKHWLRFAGRLTIREKEWPTARKYKKNIFWLMAGKNPLGLFFSPSLFIEVVDFNPRVFEERLIILGFQRRTNNGGLEILFRDKSDETLYEGLLELIKDLVK